MVTSNKFQMNHRLYILTTITQTAYACKVTATTSSSRWQTKSAQGASSKCSKVRLSTEPEHMQKRRDVSTVLPEIWVQTCNGCVIPELNAALIYSGKCRSIKQYLSSYIACYQECKSLGILGPYLPPSNCGGKAAAWLPTGKKASHTQY